MLLGNKINALYIPRLHKAALVYTVMLWYLQYEGETPLINQLSVGGNLLYSHFLRGKKCCTAIFHIFWQWLQFKIKKQKSNANAYFQYWYVFIYVCVHLSLWHIFSTCTSNALKFLTVFSQYVSKLKESYNFR